ncbi:hypothetical protein BC833DRAFT_612430 [Globomyces pollinis-pini]|nr:hypothetical protein BC833DRAFT_612430 [Globomyces pollinis-pini]
MTISTINIHQTTCAFTWSGLILSSLQARSPPISVPSSSGCGLSETIVFFINVPFKMRC